MTTPDSTQHSESQKPLPIWKHPYTLYVAITIVLFLFLVVMGWLAMENDWIPSRGFKK